MRVMPCPNCGAMEAFSETLQKFVPHFCTVHRPEEGKYQTPNPGERLRNISKSGYGIMCRAAYRAYARTEPENIRWVNHNGSVVPSVERTWTDYLGLKHTTRFLIREVTFRASTHIGIFRS